MICIAYQGEPNAAYTCEILSNVAPGSAYDPTASPRITPTPTPAGHLPLAEDKSRPGLFRLTLADADAAQLPDGSYTYCVRDAAGNLAPQGVAMFSVMEGDDGSKGGPFVLLPYVNGATIKLYGAVIAPAPKS